MGSARLAITWFLVISSLSWTALNSHGAEQASPKRILLISSFSARDGYALNFLRSKFRAELPWTIDLGYEFLDGRRFDETGYEEVLTESLSQTYRKSQPDIVLVVSYTGLQFLVRHHDELFPGVPILFLDVDPDQIKGQRWPGITGVTANAGFQETIELALRFHPATKSVAIISSDSTADKYFLERIRTELLGYKGRVTEIDLVGLSEAQLMDRVGGLPSGSIVLFQLARRESKDPAIGVQELLGSVAQRLPTYSVFPGDVLGFGGVGGVGYDWDPELSLLEGQIKRILSGERPETIPILNYNGLHPELDWRQLQRWKIPRSALPEESVILYREPSFWERHRNYIIAALVVILVQALLIAALLWQRARKRKAEAVLRESEQRFRVMADHTPSLIWMCDESGKITYLNDKRLAFAAADGEDGYGDTWKSQVHPDDLAAVVVLNGQALNARKLFSKEYRLLRNDGAYRWMFDVASPRFNGDGSFAGFIGSAIDITDQKIMQQALERVSGQLIEAQEKERTRIARELHDDICQRLALLSMELEQANRNGAPPATKQRLEEIRQHCAEIAGDVQSLSHQLHSSKLDYLGLAAAARALCREFAKQHKADIEFTDQDVPRDLPREVSLCLFRITQEALYNAFKYSATRQYIVSLTGAADGVRLVVKDHGRGFDVEGARHRGLGLVSMQERANLVHGKCNIQSSPGSGTTVTVTVPLPPKPQRVPDETPVDDSADAARAC